MMAPTIVHGQLDEMLLYMFSWGNFICSFIYYRRSQDMLPRIPSGSETCLPLVLTLSCWRVTVKTSLGGLVLAEGN